MTVTTVLDKILVSTREEIVRSQNAVPLETLQQMVSGAGPTLDFAGALKAKRGPLGLIAEVKKASPSAGIIREDFDPVSIAKAYENAGASCISVLTDKPFFQGDLDFLRAIRAEVSIPLLRKDFIIDPYQVWEARAAGADCILLIAECLTPVELKTLYTLSSSLGMQTLIELYDEANLPAVLDTDCQLVGVNNRDLRTFHTDLYHTVRLREKIPQDRLLVAESGIRTHDDVRMLATAGVDAMLVGESLMRQTDIDQAVKNLLFSDAS